MHSINGMIHIVDEKNRIIGIVDKNRINYYYLTRSQMHKFDLYLKKGVFVSFYIDKKAVVRNHYKATEIKQFVKITVRSGRRVHNYYDTNHIQEELKKIINKPTYRMFLDFEFTMPPYSHKPHSGGFTSEIIRYGFYIEDEDGKIVDSVNDFVKPKLSKTLSDRTIDFLGINNYDIYKAPSFYKFYNLFNEYMMLYQPTIYVWGRNDILVLDKTYEMYNLKKLTKRNNFINLMQIIKTYFSIKDDIGLYSAYSLFNKKPPMDVQDHNPLHDALCELEIYHLFSEQINK